MNSYFLIFFLGRCLFFPADTRRDKMSESKTITSKGSYILAHYIIAIAIGGNKLLFHITIE